MPLSAEIENEEIIAPDLSTEEWTALRKEVKCGKKKIIMRCCGVQGYMRISELGLQHFVHKSRRNCDWKPESLEHIHAKVEILFACRDAGFEARPEQSGDGWRADVLAKKDQKRIAFEVEISKNKNFENILDKQKNYSENKIKGCWFVKKLPSYAFKEEINNAKLPIFNIDFNNNVFEVILTNRRHPLYLFTKALLNKEVKFCKRLLFPKEQILKILVKEYKCHKCPETYLIYEVTQGTSSNCGNEFSSDYMDAFNLHFNKLVADEVLRYLSINQLSEYKMATIKTKYIAYRKADITKFRCPECDAYFTELYEIGSSKIKSKKINFEIKVDFEKPFQIEAFHWCFPENGEFCDFPKLD